MAQKIREIMTPSPVTLQADRPIHEAATLMKENGIGDVIVLDNGEMCGIVTDRDIAIRVIADGRDPKQTKVSEICSHDVASVQPDDDVDAAIRLVRERAIRRVPVVEGGQPVGIVAIGDLAIEKDQDSALASVSAAPPNA
jgi:signal-transduction protein with cAMP-binding, CBS, and nucleotidyltransferase domain